MRVAMGLPLVNPGSGGGNSPATSRSPAPRSPIPSLEGGRTTSSTNSPLFPTTPTGTPSLAPPSQEPPTTLSPQPHRPTRLIRSPSSSSSSSNLPPLHPPGPQSMKLLLTTLKDMSDAMEQAQKIAWDAFIQRRQQVLLTNVKKSNTKNGTHEDLSPTSSNQRRRRRRAQDRPRTILTTGDGGNELVGEAFAAREGSSEDLSEKGWAWSEDLVGVSQMGVAGKSGKEDWAEFKELVRKGVPIVYRPK